MRSGETNHKNRGRLKIFFSYAQGTGKTHAMLSAALVQRKRGVDTVIGFTNAKQGSSAASLLKRFEHLPLCSSDNGSCTVQAFDLDAALKRKPQLIILDQLACFNPSFCRHSMRQQDIDELLGAGIDVYTTLNVENIESLNDIVVSITGESVKERIPDVVFDGADQVEMVDEDPEALMQRLHIHDPGQLEKLSALRELALRRCADRINRLSMQTQKQYSAYLTDEHVLVCLSSAPSNAKIIRTAARMASAFHGRFTALYVETPDFAVMEESNRIRLRKNTRLAEQLGASIETVYGDDVPYQIAEYARLSGVTKIVLGRSAAARNALWRTPNLTEQLIAKAPNLDIHIIPDGGMNQRYRPRRAAKNPLSFSVDDTAKSIAILLGVTSVNMLFYNLGFSDANLIMVYILGVLLTAVATTHRAYSLFSALASVLLFNFIFTQPRFSLHAFDAGYPITFAVMFLAAYMTGTLATRLKDNARQSAQAAYRTQILFDTDQLLSRAENQDEIIHVLAQQLIRLLGRDVVIYQKNGDQLGEPTYFSAHEHTANTELISLQESAVALWVSQHNKHAGATTDTFSDAKCLYLAIRINHRVYGVAGIDMHKGALDAFEHSVLLSMLGEGALALENDKNAREKEEAAVLARNEQLRANLLRTISHDLRTPLTTISGNAVNLLTNSANMEETTRQQLYADMVDDSMWLINLVENLLSVTRIEDGRMNLNPTAELMEEIIDEALRHVTRHSGDHIIKVHSSDKYMLVHADAKLIVQVLVNLIDNAIKYTPAGSRIDITVHQSDDVVHISVADNGPGIADDAKEHVFEMFYTGHTHIADSRRSLGLGLCLCKSIINAHGGYISVRDNQPHGAIFTFTLPAEEVSLYE